MLVGIDPGVSCLGGEIVSHNTMDARLSIRLARFGNLWGIIFPHSDSAPHSFIPNHWSSKNDSRSRPNSRRSARLLQFLFPCRHVYIESCSPWAGSEHPCSSWCTKSRYCHITPVLAGMHWLPVRQRIDFKIATNDFRVLHRQQSLYLARILPRYIIYLLDQSGPPHLH